jgi:hypothetical protein
MTPRSCGSLQRLQIQSTVPIVPPGRASVLMEAVTCHIFCSAGAHHCPIHGGWLEVLCPHCGEPTPYRLNAHLLNAPFRCGNCRTFYCAHAHYFVKRKALSVNQRAAMTRLRLHHYVS